jgi:hypothetical protein
LSDAVKRWRDKQRKRRERFFERSLVSFKGKVFQVRHVGPSERQLQEFHLEKGIRFDYSDMSSLDGWREAMQRGIIDENENVIATGKIVATKVKRPGDKEYDLIVGVQVLTTKGLGYLPRGSLFGPLMKDPGGVLKLITKR